MFEHVFVLLSFVYAVAVTHLPGDEGPIDMPAFFARQRPVIFAAFGTMILLYMFQSWWDRDTPGQDPNTWLYADLTMVPMLMATGLAGWARAPWAQWLGGIGTTVLSVFFLANFALG